MQDLARFLSSDAAPAFDSLCQHYGLDPAAALGIEDDFLAWQLRYGLVAGSWDEDESTTAEARMADGLGRIDAARRAMG